MRFLFLSSLFIFINSSSAGERLYLVGRVPSTLSIEMTLPSTASDSLEIDINTNWLGSLEVVIEIDQKKETFKLYSDKFKKHFSKQLKNIENQPNPKSVALTFMAP